MRWPWRQRLVTFADESKWWSCWIVSQDFPSFSRFFKLFGFIFHNLQWSWVGEWGFQRTCEYPFLFGHHINKHPPQPLFIQLFILIESSANVNAKFWWNNFITWKSCLTSLSSWVLESLRRSWIKKELNSKSQSTNGIRQKVKIFPNRSGWPKWNAWCKRNQKINTFITFIHLYRLTWFIYLSSLAWAGWLCCLAGLNFSIKVPRAADLIFKTQSPPDRKKMFDWFKPNQDKFTKKGKFIHGNK